MVGGVVVVGFARADEADGGEGGLEFGDGGFLALFGGEDELEEFGVGGVPGLAEGLYLEGDWLGEVGAGGADVVHAVAEVGDGGVNVLGLDASKGLFEVGGGEGVDERGDWAARAFHGGDSPLFVLEG